MGDSEESVNLSEVLRELKEQENVELLEIARRCGVSYQTVKNAIHGRSPNAKFISALVAEFDLTQKPDSVTSIAVGFSTSAV